MRSPPAHSFGPHRTPARRPSSTTARGRQAETLCARWLEEQGMRILGRNLRFGSLELDIVASEASPRGPTLVVVEVRSRSESAYGTALSGLNGRKQRYLLRAAAALLSSGRFADYERIRIDVCIVHIPPGVTESSGAVEVVGAVEHFPGAIVR